MCWWRGVTFSFVLCFGKTGKARENEHRTPVQTKVLMTVMRFMQRDGSFSGRVLFLPFSLCEDRGYLDRSNYQRKEPSIVWSSFLRVTDVESVLSFGNPEMVIFLSCSCSNQGQVGFGLTVNSVYLHYCASFVPEVPRRAFLQGCQLVYIFEKWSSFLLCTKRYENSRRRPARYFTSIIVLRKPL